MLMMPAGDQGYGDNALVGERVRSTDRASRERFRGKSLGRVRANKMVLNRPDDANTVSAKAVTANGTSWPLNSEKRAAEMGNTCRLFGSDQQRNKDDSQV